MMKTINLKNYLLLIIVPFIFSCSNNETDDFDDSQVEDDSIEDISGIWTLPENDIYYIALYPSGKYSFCLSDYLIGSGTYYLNGNTLILNDGYTYRKNELFVKLENSKLNIRGNLYGIPNPIPGHKEYIQTVSFYLDKSINESFSKSIAGFYKCEEGTLNAYYSTVINELDFISNYLFKYTSTGKSRSNGRWKTLKNDTYYYNYREPYVYCYNTESNPTELEIYDFFFIYDKSGNYGYLDFELDIFRVN